jgi:sugar O-acyltransferase (sialic acid O-acetyltransferase NeuD family)
MKKIAIIGSGGFGREVQMLIEQINVNKKEYEFIGYFDDGFSRGTSINGFPILGGVKDINNIDFKLFIVSAIGEPRLKEKLLNQINNVNINYPILIHPNVQIGDRKFVNIGKGSIITAGVVITVNINIGKHVILNLSCTVGHDTNIGDFSSFMPTVNISGEVEINKGVFVGTGAKIINQLEIGKYTVIGAGAVVAKSLPDNCTAVGIPAKPIKFH